MKKILIISCIIGIISISMILNKSYNTYKEVNIGDNKVNIAISLDGSSINDVPSKGNYRVNVSCENAIGKWDYSRWKLLVNNIKNANIVCLLDFTTVNPADNYLNDKVTSLVGNGEVFNEENLLANYDSAVSLTQSDYKNVSMYSSSSQSSNSGNANTNSFSYNGTSWSSIPANLTSNTYYHIKFNVPSDGYYQFCYTLSKGNYNNFLFLYNGTIDLKLEGSYIIASSNSEKSGCQDIGYITTNDNLRVIQRAYTSIATSSFYLKKVITWKQ